MGTWITRIGMGLAVVGALVATLPAMSEAGD
jgi:hypothetical protein